MRIFAGLSKEGASASNDSKVTATSSELYEIMPTLSCCIITFTLNSIFVNLKFKVYLLIYTDNVMMISIYVR